MGLCMEKCISVHDLLVFNLCRGGIIGMRVF